MAKTRQCVICGAGFVPVNNTQKTCTPTCSATLRVEQQRRRHGYFCKVKSCVMCGVEFINSTGSKKTCSRECSIAFKRAQRVAWGIRNPNYFKQHHRLNSDRDKARSRAWRAANRERDRENRRLWVERNREYCLEYQRQYRASHKERIRQLERQRSERMLIAYRACKELNII